MPKLILTIDDKIIDEYPIEKDIVTIGRRADNDICLDNLAISGYHSQIKIVLNDCFLEDLNSTNGTFVNSKLVKKHALKDGDVIDVGNHRIKYINHLAAPSANSDFEKTVVVTPKTNKSKADQTIEKLVDEIDALVAAENQSSVSLSNKNNIINERIATPIDTTIKNKKPSSHTQEDSTNQPAITNNNVGRIQILSGSNSGKELVLDKSLTTIGKPNVAVVGITKRRNGYFIVHVEGNSDAASKLNGEIIEGKARPLEDHDIIDVAGIKLEFFVE